MGLNAEKQMTKPYHQVPIEECGEPLVPIPADVFVLPQEHPYAALGAPYGERSPYSVRQSVLKRLHQAQDSLQQQRPGWGILIFDAYRPLAVQQFMVDYSIDALARSRDLDPQTLTHEQRQHLAHDVQQFWAVPSSDPATPPPHSTGAAIDITLADPSGHPVSMGSPIDELSPRSYPDHFAPVSDPDSPTYDPIGATVHRRRQLLRQVMLEAGFSGHPKEWWHFSYGDQMWVWHTRQSTETPTQPAFYGRVAESANHP